MKRRLLATFLSLCLLVGLLPTVALATDEEPGAELSAVCTCEALCTEGAADETCPVCAEGYTLCTYAAPDEPVCAQLDGCVDGAHAADCPLYEEPTDDTQQEQEQKEPAAQPVTSTESTADLLSGTLSSSTSQALEGAEGSDLTWELTDGTLTISGTGAMKDYGYSGREQQPWNRQKGSITKVAFSDGVTHIGSFAFFNHTNLESFEMADSVVSFGVSAFQGCSALTAMPELHANFQDFSTEVFVGTEISEYRVDADNPYYTVKDGILYTKNGNTLVNCPPGKTGNFDQSWLAGVTDIAPHAFRTCKSLTGSLVIPENITSIGQQAFQDCSGLTGDLTIPDGITDNLANTFSGCSGLNGTLTLGDGITEIGSAAFNKCNFTSIVWGKNVTTISDQNAFANNTALTSVTLPETITTLGKQAFYKNSALKTVILPDNLESMGEAAFRESGVENIVIPSSLSSIPKNAFYGCASLKTVYISDGVTSIGEYAFNKCNSLHNVYIPQSVTSFGLNALKPDDGTSATRVFYLSAGVKPSSLNGNIYGSNDTIVWGLMDGGEITPEKFVQGQLISPNKAGYIFNGWVIADGHLNAGDELNDPTNPDETTYIAQWIDLNIEEISLQYQGTQTVPTAPDGVTFSNWQTEDSNIATVTDSTITAVNVGETTITATATYNGNTAEVSIPVKVTPRVLTYTNKDDTPGSGSITYNYTGGHHALSASLTFKWADEPGKEVTLVEGTDINYTYTVTDSEGQGGGTTQTYDYLPMPVGTYENVKFNLLNENYTFGLSGGGTRNYLEIDVNVAAGKAQRAYLASAAPKADQNFVYTGQGVLPVEGTLNAYTEDSTSSATVEIGTFTVNIEGLNDTSFHEEVSGIESGTDLSAISGLDLPIEPGTYIITASAANDNYYLYKSLVFTISKATVTVKADDKSIYVGDAIPELTYSVSGLVGDDKLSGTVSLACEATDTNTAGTYTITPSGAAVPNTEHYNSEINYQSGTLTISTRSSGGSGSSSGGSSSSNVSGSGDDVSISASGGSVTASQMESAVKKADEGAAISIKATGSSKISLPASGLESAADNDNSLTLDLRYGEVTLSPEALSAVADQSGSTVTMTVAPVDTDELNSRQQAAVGDAPVFDLTIRSGSTVISDFDGGLATVSIPYELPSSQDPAGVVVWFMDDDGNITPCETMYDTRTETVIFTTRHFSKYVIGYEEPTVFTDVSEDAYYADAVLWAVANGVTNGTSATTFSPDMAVSRAQMVTFLWRAHSSPKATGANPFTDVSASDYYYDAVLWAVANGVTNGTSATTFSPDTAVTRAQAVTFQWRAAGSPVVSGSSFGDVAADAYYVNAVTWAVANGITNGTGGNTFSPDVVVSRAQAVTFLYRELA